MADPPFVIIGNALLGTAIVPDIAVSLSAGRIVHVGPRDEFESNGSARVLDAGDGIVAPGFVDLHIHGYGGHTAEQDPAAMARALVREGTTYFLPTVMTNRLDQMIVATRHIRLACGAVPGGASIGGVHLEGPYLSPRHGAQQAGYTATPDDATTARFLDAAGDRLAMMTLAPELSGAIETTQRLVAAGVVVSLGHTACGPEDYRAARRAGASHVTHLFNAMQSPEAVRGDPYVGVRPVGLEELALVDDDVSIDLVVDSECAHVSTAVLESALRCKPEGTVSLISDSMAAGGLPPGEHRLADGRTIHTGAHHDVARLPGGLLCGSTMSMAGALRNAVQQLGVPVATALRMVTEAPARVLGIDDRVGRIGVGAAADLTILSPDLHVRTTIVGGIPAYSTGENEDR